MRIEIRLWRLWDTVQNPKTWTWKPGAPNLSFWLRIWITLRQCKLWDTWPECWNLDLGARGYKSKVWIRIWTGKLMLWDTWSESWTLYLGARGSTSKLLYKNLNKKMKALRHLITSLKSWEFEWEHEGSETPGHVPEIWTWEPGAPSLRFWIRIWIRTWRLWGTWSNLKILVWKLGVRIWEVKWVME